MIGVLQRLTMAVVLCVGVGVAPEAQSSKFVGPTEIIIRARVYRRVPALPKEHNGVRWGSAAADGPVIWEAVFLSVVRYTDPWKMKPIASYLPRLVYFTCTEGQATANQERTLRIERSPVYADREMIIIGAQLHARILEDGKEH